MIRIAHLHKLHFAIAIEEVHVHGLKALSFRKLLADILDGSGLEHSILVNAAHKLIYINRIRRRILDIALERFAKRIRSRLIHGIRRDFFCFEIDIINRCVFSRKRFNNGNIAFQFFFLFCNFLVQLNLFDAFLIHNRKRHNDKSRDTIPTFHNLHYKTQPRIIKARGLKEQFTTVIMSQQSLDILRTSKTEPFILVLAID